MKFVKSYLAEKQTEISMFILFVLLFFLTFYLYHLPLAAVAYPTFVCACIGALLLGRNCYKSYRKHIQLQELLPDMEGLHELLPLPESVSDADYQELIAVLCEGQRELENRMNLCYSDMIDYYTLWAHQIKTPIASMRLILQSEDSENARRISEELFRIEQYVEMVLMFLRLDSDTTDYCFREYSLDEIVRQSVKKFAGQFIRRKLRLDYKPIETSAVTDEKWLSFVIEQVISNALKYTRSGTVTIELEKPKTLVIRDTGIGIALEDLPRIFEKGYTGYNGREDKKASGLGLYLCKQICKNLGHTISANSTPDVGTEIRIGLERKRLDAE